MTEYSSHREQLARAPHPANRRDGIVSAFEKAFSKYIILEEVKFVCFSELNVLELGMAIFNYPIIIKPLSACVNVAQRAIKRDLQIDIDTYATHISLEKASALAGYIKPLLPDHIAISALIELDRYFWVDKEMRQQKGQWEKLIENALMSKSKRVFKKIKFTYGDEEFEIDSAYVEGEIPIAAFDAKRIESPRDIHKRSDEILTKALKLKSAYPDCKFYSIVYYPFPNDHVNI